MMVPSVTHRFRYHRAVLRVGMLALKASLFLPLSLLCQSRVVSSIDVPFDFSAGKQVLPAGNYQLIRVSDHLYSLRQRDGKAVQQMVVYDAFRAQASQDGKLTFHRYGTQCFLSSFWMPGSQNGYQTMRGKAEREVLAARVPSASDVVVAINQVAEPR